MRVGGVPRKLVNTRVMTSQFQFAPLLVIEARGTHSQENESAPMVKLCVKAGIVRTGECDPTDQTRAVLSIDPVASLSPVQFHARARTCVRRGGQQDGREVSADHGRGTMQRVRNRGGQGRETHLLFVPLELLRVPHGEGGAFHGVLQGGVVQGLRGWLE